MWLLRLVKQSPDRAGMVRVIGSDALRREMRLTVKEKIELVLKQKTRNMNGLDLSSCKHRLLPKPVSRAVFVQTLSVIGKNPTSGNQGEKLLHGPPSNLVYSQEWLSSRLPRQTSEPSTTFLA